jgi:hypothetical protein
MRISKAILLKSKQFDFLGQKDFSLKVLFPVVTDINFIEHEGLSEEEYSLVLKDCINYSQRYKLSSDSVRLVSISQ